MLTLVGALNVAQGLLVGFAGDKVGFDRNDVAFTSAGTWAAATVTLGAMLAGAGIALRAKRPSAKAVAASVVALHAISQLAMLSAYPAWSLLMVTLDVIILFILTVPRGSVVAAPDDRVMPARPAPTAKLTLRRNSRSDAYRGRHKAGRPPVRHSVSRDDIITIDLLPPEVVAGPSPMQPPACGHQDDTVVVKALVGAPVSAALLEETVEAELVGDTPTVWVRAVGQATVPAGDAAMPVQRASLESLDPLIDPLPLVLAEEEAIAAEELAAIGARPYVNR
ncbi:hypothetical protein ABT369_54900 [Dactylosporangium sp. NPDC000244]|uniref:DUF7144 family membrane protein n=1 Tax=Dactylosporangium sp. NPDC000244 TaxID=3154365 RepID=UPI00332F7089